MTIHNFIYLTQGPKTRRLSGIIYDFSHFFDCSNQTSITSVRNEIFWFCKKYLEPDAV